MTFLIPLGLLYHFVFVFPVTSHQCWILERPEQCLVSMESVHGADALKLWEKRHQGGVLVFLSWAAG